jgi:oligosaccharyltransferase complex subunit epsilon
VGQFVLTISLRMQTVEQSPSETSAGSKAKTVDGVEEKGTGQISSERAFADFVFGSLILHGFCVNFVN